MATLTQTSRPARQDTAAPDDTPFVDLAVIIPAFNEQDGVGPTLERVKRVLAAMPCSCEIIVVDDGSGDATAERVEKHGVRVIRHSQNRGYGAALFVIGTVKFICDLFLWDLSETAVMAFLGAVVVWAVALLADMIAEVELTQRGVS